MDGHKIRERSAVISCQWVVKEGEGKKVDAHFKWTTMLRRVSRWGWGWNLRLERRKDHNLSLSFLDPFPPSTPSLHCSTHNHCSQCPGKQISSKVPLTAINLWTMVTITRAMWTVFVVPVVWLAGITDGRTTTSNLIQFNSHLKCSQCSMAFTYSSSLARVPWGLLSLERYLGSKIYTPSSYICARIKKDLPVYIHIYRKRTQSSFVFVKMATFQFPWGAAVSSSRRGVKCVIKRVCDMHITLASRPFIHSFIDPTATHSLKPPFSMLLISNTYRSVFAMGIQENTLWDQCPCRTFSLLQSHWTRDGWTRYL